MVTDMKPFMDGLRFGLEALLRPGGSRGMQRVRYELRRRNLRVAAVQPLSPHFVRIDFRGPELAGFESRGFDDHVKLLLPPGSAGAPAGARRDYTPRAYDAAQGILSIEFVTHGHGAAGLWAQQVKPGDQAVIGGPKGSMLIPVDYDWHLLVGDATALPAICRRLEELPAGARAQVLVQLDDAADRRELRSAATVEVQWLRTPAELLQALAALRLPAGEGFAWGAGEAGLARQVREHLLRVHGLGNDSLRVAAYWKAGDPGYHERLG